MRITHNILISNFLRNLDSISNRIERGQEQLSTGLKYSRPCHGPIEVGQIVGFESTLSHIDQYLKNVDDGTSHVNYVDTIVQSVIGNISRTRELAIDGANDNLNSSDRQAIAQEIDLILETVFSNANSRFRGKYSFAGWHTQTQPFEAVYNPRTGSIDDVIYHGNRGRIDRMAGDDDRIKININGQDLFHNQTYTLQGKVLPPDIPLGFNGTLTINDINITITPDMTLEDIQLTMETSVPRTRVFASIINSRLVLESATSSSKFTITDNRGDKLLENLGLDVKGAFNNGMSPSTLPIVDSTPAIFTGAGPVANLTYDNTNNCMNIFLGADANEGVSNAANIFITPGTYASVADLIIEIQTQIDTEFGAGRIKVSDAGGGVLQLETVATGDEIDLGDLVIGGPYNGYNDTASDSADLNLIAVVGNAPATNAGTAGTDGNDKLIIDLGPSASKSGLDVLPQVIDLRAGMITTVDDLLTEIKYQIFHNDVLRGTLEVELINGRLHFETREKGEDVLAEDFQISEGATGTLAALGLSDVTVPAQYSGNPLAYPFIIVAGFNDTIIVDLGPTVSLDGTDPPPYTLTISPGIYNNINAIFNEFNAQIQAHPDLSGAIQTGIGGPPGAEYLMMTSVNTGSYVRGEDMSVTGLLALTLGWTNPTAINGGGTSPGQSVELEPSNIFDTIITIRDDLMGTAGPDTTLVNTLNSDGELLGLFEGDIVTVAFDSFSFDFPILATDTMENLATYIQDIFGSRATIEISNDGLLTITNNETHQISKMSITAESPIGESREIFNEILSEIPDIVPGLFTVHSDVFYDTQRYLRLGDEDLILSSNDLENCLRNEAIIGARANRLNTVLNLFYAESGNIDALKTTIESANYAEVLTTLSQQELVLQSALGVGARVLTPSLLDFLM